MSEQSTPASGGSSRSRRTQQQGDQQQSESTSTAAERDQPTATAEGPQPGEAATRDDDVAEEQGLAPAPEQPDEVVIYAEDAGTFVHPVSVRDEDVELSDDAVIVADPEYDRSPEAALARGRGALDDADVEPISGDQVEVLTAVSASNGLVLVVNGNSFALGPQQVGQLKQIVDRAVVGLAL